MERAIDEINKGKEAHVVSAFRLNLSNAIKKILKKLFVIYTISNNKKIFKKLFVIYTISNNKKMKKKDNGLSRIL